MLRRLLILTLFAALLLAAPLNAQEATPDSTPASASEMLGPDSYPPGVNPLTGLQVDDPALLNRRPLGIKIVNAPAAVRPQTGLAYADLVWEHELGGGVTRFTAFFLSRDVERVGPVRSLRLVDFNLARIYRSLIVFSGMSEGVRDIRQGDPVMLALSFGGVEPCPALCRDETAIADGEPLEYTLYGNTAALRELAAEQGRNVTPEPVYGMAFAQATPEGGTAVDSIDIALRQTVIRWAWDAGSQRWLRWQDGAPHLDTATEEQLSAANVLILEEEHTVQPEVAPNYWGPGNFAFSVNFIGSGRVYLFRDGQYFVGEWRRTEREAPLEYFDMAGNVLPLKPGNTYVQLVPRWSASYLLTFRLTNPPLATISINSVFLRVGPGESFGGRDAGYLGDTFPVLGRNNSGTWVQVLTPGDEVLWVQTDALTFADPLALERLPYVRATVDN